MFVFHWLCFLAAIISCGVFLGNVWAAYGCRHTDKQAENDVAKYGAMTLIFTFVSLYT